MSLPTKIDKVPDPFAPIYQSDLYKRIWDFDVQPFPLMLDIEITNACDLECIMCARTVLMKRPVGFMDFALFKQIIDQAKANGCTTMRFNGQGEPLLHKQFFDMVAYAKSQGFLIHATSNGMRLTEEKARGMITSGLDKVKFSFQGITKAEFERMRKGGNYEVLEENIKRLVRLRTELERKNPWVQIGTTILDESEEAVSQFMQHWLQTVDGAYYGKTVMIRAKGSQAEEALTPRDTSKPRDALCWEVRTKMTIFWNGDVTTCCTDYEGFLKIGSLAETSLQGIWTGEPMLAIRETLGKNSKEKLPLCRDCRSMF